jgi:hypothetical protein
LNLNLKKISQHFSHKFLIFSKVPNLDKNLKNFILFRKKIQASSAVLEKYFRDRFQHFLYPQKLQIKKTLKTTSEKFMKGGKLKATSTKWHLWPQYKHRKLYFLLFLALMRHDFMLHIFPHIFLMSKLRTLHMQFNDLNLN